MKKPLKITITVLLSLFVLLAVFSALLLWKPRNSYQAQNTEVFDKFLHANKNETISLTGSELSTMVSDLVTKKLKSNNFSISYVNANISGKYLTFYMPVKYKVLNLYITVQGTPSVKNNNLLFNLDKIYIGKIRIPVNLAAEFLKHMTNKLSIVDSSVIEISSSNLPVNVSSISINNDRFTLSVNNDINNKLSAEFQELRNALAVKPQSGISAQAPGSSETSGSGNSIPLSPQNTALENKVKDSLSKASAQLEDAYNALKDSDEKNVVSMLKCSIDNLRNNINYNCRNDAQNVRNSYNRLPDAKKKDLKSKLLANVDIANMKFLRSTFGI